MPMINGVVAPDQFRRREAVLPEIRDDVFVGVSAAEDAEVDVGAEGLGSAEGGGEEDGAGADEGVEGEGSFLDFGEVGHYEA